MFAFVRSLHRRFTNPLDLRAGRRRRRRRAAISSWAGGRCEHLEPRRLLTATPGENVAQWVQSLDYQDFNELNADEIVYLTTEQVATIPNDWWFSRISSEALNEEQTQALNVGAAGLRRLTDEQIDFLVAEQIQAVHYSQFRYLGPEQTPDLTPDQVSTIPNDWWLSRISEEARAEFEAHHVQALDVGAVGLRRLTDEQVDYLTTGQVQTLGYDQFRYLGPEQTPDLTPDQVSTIPNDWWLSRISDEARAEFEAHHVQALDVGAVGLRRLTEVQVDYLTTGQVQTLGYDQFRYLGPEQTPELTPDQVSTIPNDWWLSRISDEARAELAAQHIQALDVGAVGLRRLTDEQVDYLSTEQVQTLGYDQFRYLGPEQTPDLTPDQVSTIPNDWWLSRISDEARAEFEEPHIQALDVGATGLRRLTEEQIDYLTAGQVQTLGYDQFRYLGPEQTPDLTPDQVSTIPNGWWFTRISDEARAALTEVHVQALNVAEVGVGALTAEQAANLTAEQIQSLSYDQLRYLNEHQIPLVTGEQIAAIPNSWWFTRISEEARAAMTPEQVRSLNTAEISIRYLTGKQRAELLPEQIGQLSCSDLKYLTEEQAAHITNQQMASIPSQWHFWKMPEEVRAALSRDQLLSLDESGAAIVVGGIQTSGEPINPIAVSAQDDDGLAQDPRTLMERERLFALVPPEEATHVTIASGDWSDPAIWEDGAVPGVGADVLVGADHTVTFDVVQTAALDTLRIDGLLTFDPLQDTQLMADTIVVHTFGALHVGTVDNPIAADVAARIVIADDGPIDTTWDPLLMSRGLLSRGQLRMVGQETTSFVALAENPLEGDTQLVLAETPENWRVGDRLVLTGTEARMSRNQDEELEIIAIDGNLVTVDRPLEHDHIPPNEWGMSVYVANFNRNVVVMSENPQDNDHRGHVMLLHNSDVQIHNAGFYGLGRSDKRNPVNDPVLDDDGALIEDTGLNRRGRYSVHLHRQGVDPNMTPALVTGSAVVDSPGWGFVNHASFAHMEDNVAFHVVGAAFVTEDGNEIGSFRRNLSIHTTGSGDGIESRQDLHDFGHNGHGFWLQGPGVEVIDNIAAGNNDGAFVFFTRSGVARFDAVNLDDPSLAAGREQIPVGAAPLKTVSGNIAFASKTGLETWFHLTHMNDGQSYIEDFTSWNTRRSGMFTPYTGQTTLRNALLIGDSTRLRGTAIGRNDVTNNMTYEDIHIVGFQTGISVPVRRASTIVDGHFETIVAIRIEGAEDTLRTVDIIGDPHFETLTADQLRGREQFDIFLADEINFDNRDVETFFAPDIIRLGTVQINGKQIYYHKQAANYVPFPSDSTPPWIPEEVLDLTNEQLWETYGLAPAGIVAPADVVELEGINGLVGSPADYPPQLEMLSRKYTNELGDYRLTYRDSFGDPVADAQTIDLDEGWNLITREIEGYTQTFFVFGDIEAPTFQVSDPDSLVVNPEGLEFGFTLRGVVFDNSFGAMSFRRRFDDLRGLEILTRDDGSQYINLQFEIRDLAGNTTAVTIELNLDPDAPLAPGTRQRDLPPREMPTTLIALIEYYLLTGQSAKISDLLD